MKELENKQDQPSSSREPLEYARRVMEHNFEWYKNADTKAEIILALDGAFLAFVSSSIFTNQDELKDILESFTPLTWLFLVFMTIFLTGSIISAILCLYSRIPIFSERAKRKYFDTKENKIDIDDAETYKPEATLFFQQISYLKSKQYQEYMLKANKKSEISALAVAIHILSENVFKKHKWVDWGFILAGLSLCCFLAFIISYVITLIWL